MPIGYWEEENEKKNFNARNEHDIPLSLLQPRLLHSLKVDDFLFQFPACLGR
jgi:hypothetical protein